MRFNITAMLLAFAFLTFLACQSAKPVGEPAGFSKFYIEYDQTDASGWGWIRPGDMDGDGDLDLVAGGGRRLYVYENDGNARGWKPHGNLDPTGEIGSNGGVLFDVDHDGDLDVVSSRYKIDPGWWENPGGELSATQWPYHPLDSGLEGWYAHDIMLADLDGDGKREEFVFNLNRGYWEAETRIYWYTPANDPTRQWQRNVVTEGMKEQNHGHAGLDAADLNNDGRIDIVFSNGWFRAPEKAEGEGWQWNRVSTVYGISNSLAADMDNDGALDLVMAAGHHGRGVYWYRNTGGAASWEKQVVDSTVVHPEGMQVLDFDHDGGLDILAAELHFGEAPVEPDWSDQAHAVYLYSNPGSGNLSWNRSTISSRSYPAHGLLAADINQDGNLDLLGNGCGHSVISYYEGRKQPPGQQWWNEAWRLRVPVVVNMAGNYRENKPAEILLDIDRIFKDSGLDGELDKASIRLVEKDAGGNVLNDQVPFQIDPDGTLTLICTGRTGPNSSRFYDLYLDSSHGPPGRTSASVDTLVRYVGQVLHEEQESFHISTPSATYYYHKAGAGFASMEDRDSIDWLGYRPCCESAGQYRGIPNMWKFHPGQDSSYSTVEIDGPLRVRIRSVAVDSSQECVWDIFPDYARMTLLNMDKTYWFLYEGTPGGSLETERDYNVISNGLRRSIIEHWHGDLPGPEWVYFGDDSIRRTLYVSNDQDDDRTDQFWQMREEMVVFGFGREYRCCGTYMDRLPASFTVGFAEDSSFATVGKVIANASLPLSVVAGQPQMLMK
jgi:hypothetical protein